MKLSVGYLGDRPIREFVEYVTLAEKKGFECVWLADHYCLREFTVCMTATVMSTKRIKVASGVANPYTSHPAVYAMSLATLRELAGDRCIFGIGAAIRPQEQLLGRMLDHNMSRLREAILIIRELLNGREITHHGETVHVNRLKLDFGSPAKVPIYLGGINQRMASLAGEICDGFLATAGASVSYLKEAIRWIDEGARKSGRDPLKVKKASLLFLSSYQDSEKAKAYCKRWLATFMVNPYFEVIAKHSGVDLQEIRSLRDSVKSDGVEEGSKRIPDYVVNEFAAVGTPRECRKKIEEFAELEIDELTLLPSGPTPIQMISEMANELADYLELEAG